VQVFDSWAGILSPAEYEKYSLPYSRQMIWSDVGKRYLKVFREAHRALRKGGRMVLSDIVLLEELTPEQRGDKELLAGCVAGALMKDDYLDKLKSAGFEIKILGEDRKISKLQYNGIALESVQIEAVAK